MFEKLFGSLFNNLDLTNKYSLLYNFIFIYRRLFISFYVTQLSHIQSIQVIVLQYQNLMCFLFIGLVKPFKSKEINQLELICEFLIGLLTICMVTFTPFAGDPQARFDSGWLYIIFFMMVIILQMGNTLRHTFKLLWLYCIYFYNCINQKRAPI